MTVKEELKYMLNVPEDFDTLEIAMFLLMTFNIEDDITDIIEKLESNSEGF